MGVRVTWLLGWSGGRRDYGGGIRGLKPPKGMKNLSSVFGVRRYNALAEKNIRSLPKSKNPSHISVSKTRNKNLVQIVKSTKTSARIIGLDVNETN